MPFWGPIIGAAIGVIGGLKIQKRQEKVAREAEKRNQSYLEDSKANDLSKTVKAAEKAGINPLTAIRSGAGNYQSNRAIMPSMSGYEFAVQAMSQGARSAIAYAETYRERALDALLKTQQVKALEVETALDKKRLNEKVVDVYAGFPDKIPVKFGFKSFAIPTEIAKRSGIEPYDRVTAGEIAELMGEGAELITSPALAAQSEQYDTNILGLAAGDAVMDKTQFELELEKARPMHRVGSTFIKRETMTPALSPRNFKKAASQ